MQVEIGKIYEGTVKNIMRYGMFVSVHDPDGQRFTGMVHISEVSRSYVGEIRDFVTEGQRVKVKAIGINPLGKISLSMKQAEEDSAPAKADGEKRHGGSRKSQGANRAERPPRRGGENPSAQMARKKTPPAEMTFEDMLSRFKQNSEERMGDIKRNTERKNRSRRK